MSMLDHPEIGGYWANDAARPVPSDDRPYPWGFNLTSLVYEYWNGSAWVQTGGSESDHQVITQKDVNLSAGGLTTLFSDLTAKCVVIRCHVINWVGATGPLLNYQIDTLGGLLIVNPPGPAALATGITLETVNQGVLIPAADVIRFNVLAPVAALGSKADVEIEVVVNS